MEFAYDSFSCLTSLDVMCVTCTRYFLAIHPTCIEPVYFCLSSASLRHKQVRRHQERQLIDKFFERALGHVNGNVAESKAQSEEGGSGGEGDKSPGDKVPHSLYLAGGPGTGKSSIVREFCSQWEVAAGDIGIDVDQQQLDKNGPRVIWLNAMTAQPAQLFAVSEYVASSRSVR